MGPLEWGQANPKESVTLHLGHKDTDDKGVYYVNGAYLAFLKNLPDDALLPLPQNERCDSLGWPRPFMVKDIWKIYWIQAGKAPTLLWER